MNRLFHFLVFLFLITALFGQDCVLDSSWNMTWSEIENGWEEPARTHYFYDKGLLDTALYIATTSSRDIYSYDENGILFRRTLQVQNSFGDWVDLNIRTHKVEENKEISCQIKLDENGEITETGTYCVIYDVAGNQIERSSEIVRNGGSSLAWRRSYEYIYYDSGVLHMTLEKRWDEETMQWEKHFRNTYLYDNDKLVSDTEEKWNELLEGYEYWNKHEYEYVDGLLNSETLSFNSFGDDFKIEEKTFYLYDSDQRLVREDILEFDFAQKVDGHHAIDYIYDSCGPLKERLSSNRDLITNEWHPINKRINYYSTITKVSEISTLPIRIFPNPATNKVSFELGETFVVGILTIYNLKGQLVLQESIHRLSSIDISLLAEGQYVIKILEEGQEHSGSFVKI